MNTASGTNALVIDAMALIQALKSIPSTFGELADTILRIIISLSRQYNACRVDFVGDRYPDISINNFERENDGVIQLPNSSNF